MARKRRAKFDISHLKSSKFSRRQFMVRSAAGIAGATMATAGFAWGDLAYARQLKGKPVKFNVAIRPDWTQGWFGMINEEKKIWKKYLPEGSEVTFSHPIQGGIVTNELIAGKSMIGHNGDAPGLIATLNFFTCADGTFGSSWRKFRTSPWAWWKPLFTRAGVSRR